MSIKAELGVITNKIKAQVPVTLAEMRGSWWRMVDAFKTGPLPPDLPQMSKTEGLAYFEHPAPDPVFCDLKAHFKQIVEQYEKNGHKMDDELLQQINNGDDPVQALRGTAAMVRTGFDYTADSLEINLFLTAVARALVPECSHLECRFQAHLNVCAEIRQLAADIDAFANRLLTPVAT